MNKMLSEGAECVILRQYDEVHQSYNSWYRLSKPVAATATLGYCNDAAVTLRYESKGPRQGARFYVPRDAVPAEQRMTRYVKVAEKLDDTKEPRYVTKMTTTVPEAVFDAMQRGEDVPGDVVARLNQSVMLKGPRCKEAKKLWAALQGKTPVCIFFSTN